MFHIFLVQLLFKMYFKVSWCQYTEMPFFYVFFSPCALAHFLPSLSSPVTLPALLNPPADSLSLSLFICIPAAVNKGISVTNICTANCCALCTHQVAHTNLISTIPFISMGIFLYWDEYRGKNHIWFLYAVKHCGRLPAHGCFNHLSLWNYNSNKWVKGSFIFLES